jgi:NADH-quinone oxidoreductase subunit F
MDSSSIAHGAEQTLAAIRETCTRLGVQAEIGITGTIGTSYADPTIDIARPGGPRVLYGYVTADVVPQLLHDVLVSGNDRADMALGVIGDQGLGEIPSLWDIPFFKPQVRRLMADYGIIDPVNLDHYIAHGGYEGLNRALGMTPEQVIDEMNRSGLTGRGGAFFPTGRKWDFLRTAKGDEKYILCNADEGDPGSYVNRAMMESEPFQLLEGMAIACWATGAKYAKIYLRSEYPLAGQRLQQAIDIAYANGLFGTDVLGTGFHCEMELVMGAGAYVCGEETGLIASIQDARGMPRIKPPFPAQAGLFWKPTNVNNVESYASAPMIFRKGADWYGNLGIEMKGTKMFSLSGDILRPGVLEVEFGVAARIPLIDIGGGTPSGRPIKAVQIGGPLSGYLPGTNIDDPLTRTAMTALGTLVGSGGLVVMDDSRCIIDMTRMLMRFCQDESCGRCTTCRIGGMRLTDLTDRVAAGGGRLSDFDIIANKNEYMQDSNCVHGQFTPTAIVAAVRHFRDEWEEHIRDGYCAAKTCEGLTMYAINPYAVRTDADAQELVESCPTGAIVRRGESVEIVQERCIKCGACAQVNNRAVEVLSPVPQELVFRPLPESEREFAWVAAGRR